MTSLPHTSHIALVGIFVICTALFATPFHRAYAVVPVFDSALQTIAAEDLAIDTAIAASSAITAAETTSLTTKEFSLDPLVRILVFTTLQTMTSQVTGWITGDEGRGVGFVKNLEQELTNAVDARAGEYLSRLATINLCSLNLKTYIQMKLGVPRVGNFRHLNPQLSCKLTGIVDNVENFYDNFDNGGWNAFLNVSLIPENNYYGASAIAEQNYLLAQASAANTLLEKAGLGTGFKGVQLTKQSEVCETVVLGDAEEEEELHCYTEEEVTTPGKLISESLGKSMNDIGFDSILGADELSELIDTFFSQVVNALLGQLLSGNLF